MGRLGGVGVTLVADHHCGYTVLDALVNGSSMLADIFLSEFHLMLLFLVHNTRSNTKVGNIFHLTSSLLNFPSLHELHVPSSDTPRTLLLLGSCLRDRLVKAELGFGVDEILHLLNL